MEAHKSVDSLSGLLCCAEVINHAFPAWNFPHFHYPAVMCLCSQGSLGWSDREGR